jgi:carbamoyl-phosphate synthase large subunit
LDEAGFESVMVNSNPETVSTDYDTSSRLYFEPLSAEDVLAVCGVERPVGVIAQFGGQTPLELAHTLEAEGFRILGTPPSAIDLAEDRGKFAAILRDLGIPAPPHGEARTIAEARTVAARIGYPVVVRPSYVLGGRAMEIVYDDAELERFVQTAAEASREHPVLIDRFLEAAIEVDVDAVCDGTDVFVGAVMEHIEEAGVHSGDSSCQIPPATLSDEELDRIEDITRRLARRLGVIGLLNLQLAIKDEKVWVLEANPRASRTVPFVSKVIGVSLARVATLVLTGRPLSELMAEGVIPSDPTHYRSLPYTAVKAAVLPFGRFPGVDTILGPEMRSTGEVMGIDADPGAALAKAMVAAGHALPTAGTVFVSVANRDKRAIVFPAKRLADLGFRLLATGGTASVLRRAGIPVEPVAKVSEGPRTGEANVVELIREGRIDLVINTPFGRGPRTDGYHIRTAAAAAGVPCVTTLPGTFAAVRGIEALRTGLGEPSSIQEHHEAARAGACRREAGPRRGPLDPEDRCVPPAHGRRPRHRREGSARAVRLGPDAGGPRVPPPTPSLDPRRIAARWLGGHDRVRDRAVRAGDDVDRVGPCPLVPRHDRTARQGLRLAASPHELSAGRGGPWRGRAVLPRAGAGGGRQARRHDRRGGDDGTGPEADRSQAAVPDRRDRHGRRDDRGPGRGDRGASRGG